MATRDDVRRISSLLPAATVDPEAMHVSVEGRAIAWPWLERLDPKRARVPNPDVIAIRVANESEKELLIEMDPAVFFTEAHYNGYPAILVRLDAIGRELLEKLLRDAWGSRASRQLVRDSTDAGDRPT
jgi:hypothetical protein